MVDVAKPIATARILIPAVPPTSVLPTDLSVAVV